MQKKDLIVKTPAKTHQTTTIIKTLITKKTIKDQNCKNNQYQKKLGKNKD
ncbi:hypothetical protein BHO_0900096 (plasmid) [Borrelia hermsii YBT]|uniref:Uncharacterized protein n=1 Tax=Borrelia hermsii YBT TaxID=1313295 RepID=W5T2W3_BORHE|nr:hypothetical protein [Borrelia hermsii]AHH13484.1 hypothetical protein BHO_0900096 [Borrelia hermsii YBT]